MAKLFIRDSTWKGLPIAGDPAGCILTDSSTSSATWQVISSPGNSPDFGTGIVRFDAAPQRDTNAFKTNNTTITIPSGLGGLYGLSANATCPGYASGERVFGYRRSGGLNPNASEWITTRTNQNFPRRMNFYTEIVLAQAETLKIVYYNGSNGAMFLYDQKVVLTRLGS